MERRKRQADRIDLLSDAEYEHFAYCQRASFNGYQTWSQNAHANSQYYQHFPLKNTKMEQAGSAARRIKLDRFRNWIKNDATKSQSQIQLSDHAVEALICLANEFVHLVVAKSIDMRFPYLIPAQQQYDYEGSLHKENLHLTAEDIEASYIELSDFRPGSRLIKNVRPPANQRCVFVSAAFA